MFTNLSELAAQIAKLIFVDFPKGLIVVGEAIKSVL